MARKNKNARNNKRTRKLQKNVLLTSQNSTSQQEKEKAAGGKYEYREM